MEHPRTLENQAESAREIAPFAKNLVDTLEKLVKIAGVVAVFGYVSLRSHLNFLGVPSQGSLGVDRYLMEAYQFLSALCYSPELVFLSLVTGLCISLASGRAARSSKHFSVWRKLGDKLHVKPQLGRALPPLLLILAGCWLLVRELQLLTRSGTGVVVGALKSDTDMVLAAISVRAAGEDHFLLVAFFFGAGFILRRLRPRNLEPFPSAAWKGLNFTIFLLALQMPVLYGAFLRPTTYSKVEVRQKEQPSVCGALILDASEKLVLWRAKNGKGFIEVLHDKDMRILVLGNVDVLTEAGRSFNSQEDVPSCKDATAKQ